MTRKTAVFRHRPPILKEVTKRGHHGGLNINPDPSSASCQPALCQGYTGSRGRSPDIFTKGSCKRSPSLIIGQIPWSQKWRRSKRAARERIQAPAGAVSTKWALIRIRTFFVIPNKNVIRTWSHCALRAAIGNYHDIIFKRWKYNKAQTQSLLTALSLSGYTIIHA